MEELPPSVATRLRELIYDESAAAWLRIDEASILTGAGGHLDHYGLTGLRLERFGCFFQFAAEDPHIAGSLDGKCDAVASNAPHLDRDIVSDVNLLTNFSAESEHPYFS